MENPSIIEAPQQMRQRNNDNVIIILPQTQPINNQVKKGGLLKTILEILIIFVLRVPWFIMALSVLIVYVFVQFDDSYFAYGCQNGLFHWKLLAYQFEHVDTEHLLYNLTGIWFFGVYLTAMYNELTTLLVYIIGIVIGGFSFYTVCYINKSLFHIVGASAGVCGLVGAVLVLSIRERKHVTNSRFLNCMSITYIILSLLMISFDVVSFLIEEDKNIAFDAHFGGYISGILTGCVIILAQKCAWRK